MYSRAHRSHAVCTIFPISCSLSLLCYSGLYSAETYSAPPAAIDIVLYMSTSFFFERFDIQLVHF